MAASAPDLRRQILDAALSLVAEGGPGALSFRKVARLAGVSHQAPYHHFSNRESILAEMIREGFVELHAAIVRSLEDVPADDPVARMHACGVSYVRFAVSHPQYYRLMFRPELCDIEAFEPTKAAGERTFDIVIGVAGELVESGYCPGVDPSMLAMTCWSTVHGAASLMVEGAIESKLNLPPEAHDPMVEHMVGALTLVLSATKGGTPVALDLPELPCCPDDSGSNTH